MYKKHIFLHTVFQPGTLMIFLIMLSMFVNVLVYHITTNLTAIDITSCSIESEQFRCMNLEEGALDFLQQQAETLGQPAAELLAVVMLRNHFQCTNASIEQTSPGDFTSYKNKMLRFYPQTYHQLVAGYDSLLKDLTGTAVFPVPASTVSATRWITYVDSWGFARTYGGERTHEGTDIMALENVRGKYPVIAVTDGTVTNLGWLEKGGYRIGITSPNGVYYYYAHLDSYAPAIAEGSAVAAGTLLGFMGNTGYSKVEGTYGKFDVHLHFGMYLYIGNQEISINPYPFLKYFEKKVVNYRY